MSKVMLSIEEPNSCDECPFSELETYGYYCQLLNKYINSLKRKEHSTIPKLCPLRELPDYRTETYKWEDRLLSLQDVIESMAYEIATYRHSNRYSHIEDVDDISVWDGNVYGNRDWDLDVWEDVSGEENRKQNLY